MIKYGFEFEQISPDPKKNCKFCIFPAEFKITVENGADDNRESILACSHCAKDIEDMIENVVCEFYTWK